MGLPFIKFNRPGLKKKEKSPISKIGRRRLFRAQLRGFVFSIESRVRYQDTCPCPIVKQPDTQMACWLRSKRTNSCHICQRLCFQFHPTSKHQFSWVRLRSCLSIKFFFVVGWLNCHDSCHLPGTIDNLNRNVLIDRGNNEDTQKKITESCRLDDEWPKISWRNITVRLTDGDLLFGHSQTLAIDSVLTTKSICSSNYNALRSDELSAQEKRKPRCYLIVNM